MAQSPVQGAFQQDIGTMLQRRGQIPGEIKAKQEELAQTTERGMADIRGTEKMLGEAVTGVQERYAGGVRSAQEEAGRSMRDVAFEPTRENLPELTQLFGMLTAATFLAGGKGRQSGMGALAAMTGAMEGYRKGQKEVFNNELKEFDKRIREVQAHNQNVRNKLNDALTTLKTDREAGMAKLKGLEMEIAGSQAQLKLRRGDIQGVVKSLQEEQKAVSQALGKAADMEQRAARDAQRYAAEQARLQQGERRLGLLEAKAAGAGAAEGGKKIKMTTGPENRFRGATESLIAINNIADKLKDPAVAKAFDDSRLFRTLLESPTELFPIQRYIGTSIFQSLPPAARELFTEIAMARNDYFRQISGQAVTGSEGARNFFATVAPTDTSEVILNKIDTLRPKFVRSLEDTIEGYELPQSVISRTRALIDQSKTQQQQVPNFSTVAEAEAANLPKGTRIMINGRAATVE